MYYYKNKEEAKFHTFKDRYELLTPALNDLSSTPYLKRYAHQDVHHNRFMHTLDIKSLISLKSAYNICHWTFGHVAMKMLKFFEDDGAHWFRDIGRELFPNKPIGHDIDCFRLLIRHKMIEFACKGRHGSKLYKITPFGHEVLGICKANDVYYRPMRWFCMDEDEMFTNMLKADLANEDTSADISTSSLLNLVKSLLSTTSPIAKLCSRYKQFNKFMHLVMTSSIFYDAINVPEINDWLDAHKHDSEVIRFYAKWKNIQKKWDMKRAA